MSELLEWLRDSPFPLDQRAADRIEELERELAEARANASAYRVDYLMAKDRLAKAEAELWRHEIKVTVLDGIGLEALKAENAALKALLHEVRWNCIFPNKQEPVHGDLVDRVEAAIDAARKP